VRSIDNSFLTVLPLIIFLIERETIPVLNHFHVQIWFKLPGNVLVYTVMVKWIYNLFYFKMKTKEDIRVDRFRFLKQKIRKREQEKVRKNEIARSSWANISRTGKTNAERRRG
jgi:hypothetical protein